MNLPDCPSLRLPGGPATPRAWANAALALAVMAAVLPQQAAAAARIDSPRAGATVHSNSGDVVVRVAGVPDGDLVSPVLDGRRLRVVYATPEFMLHGVARGAHRLAVDVLGPRRDWREQTPAVSFEVWHASRLLPAHR